MGLSLPAAHAQVPRPAAQGHEGAAPAQGAQQARRGLPAVLRRRLQEPVRVGASGYEARLQVRAPPRERGLISGLVSHLGLKEMSRTKGYSKGLSLRNREI